ncbi:hypothetical protein LLG96_00870 [bacterium]|nr:hypothetical protein [bacterium]
MILLIHSVSVVLLIFFILPLQVHAERIYTHYYSEPSISEIGDIAIDSNCVWLASVKGIARYDKKTGMITKYSIFYSAYDWPYQWATSIIVDASGTVWAGTYGAGLMQFDGDGFSFYDAADEPEDKEIRDIEMDKDGTLWMVTEKGVIAYDGTEWHIYDGTNGLPSATIFYDVSIGDDNTVWVASSRGALPES